jgi:hypothetical protein
MSAALSLIVAFSRSGDRHFREKLEANIEITFSRRSSQNQKGKAVVAIYKRILIATEAIPLNLPCEKP